MAVLIFKDIKDGFYYVTKRKPEIFKIMTLAALLNLFLVPFFIIGLPYIYRITLGLTDRLYGLSLGVIELSTIVGALTVRLVTKRMQLNTLYKWIFVISTFFAPLALAFVPQVLDRVFLVPFLIDHRKSCYSSPFLLSIIDRVYSWSKDSCRCIKAQPIVAPLFILAIKRYDPFTEGWSYWKSTELVQQV